MVRRRYDDDYDWPAYVSVAQRRGKAAHEAARLGRGQTLQPVVVDGFKIAKTFWGKAWCDNLERYSDYANRLPRGRSYVRNGLVIDLQVASGVVTALVSGSRVYEVDVSVAAVPRACWKAICADCSGEIDSVIELLRGQLSKSVMSRLCQEKTGLFPSPSEIKLECSCPDSALLCKHLAAVLYGIGARLDEKPELLFTLRKVNHEDLIARAGAFMVEGKPGRRTEKFLQSDNLSEIFGIDITTKPSTAGRKTRKSRKSD